MLTGVQESAKSMTYQNCCSDGFQTTSAQLSGGFNTDHNFSDGGNSSFTFEIFENPFSKPHIKILFIICYSIVFAMCFFGNSMVLFAIARSPRLRGMTNFFLANLAVADFCVGIFCVLPNLSTFLSQSWILGNAMCKIYYYVWNVSYTASIIILTVIAMERYIAIIHPLKSRKLLIRAKLIWVQVFIWIVAFVYNVPYLVFFNTISPEGFDEEYCYYNVDKINSMKGLSLANCIVWYLLPLITIGFMYYLVATALWKTTMVSAMRLKTVKHAKEESSGVNSFMNGSFSERRKNVTFNMTQKELSDREYTRTHVPDEGTYSSGSAVNSNSSSENFSPSKTRNGVSVVFESNFNDRHVPQLTCCIRTIPVRRQQCSCEKMVVESTNSSNSPGSNTSRASFRYNQTTLRNSRRVARARRKVIRLLIAVVISFAVCVFPHQLKVMNHYWQIIKFPHSLEVILSPVSFILLFLNSALNPILYALFSNHFRRSFKEAIPCFRKHLHLRTTG